MELWKSLLLILNEETVYAPILAIIGASLIVLKEKEDNKKTVLTLLITFFIGVMLSLTLVPFIIETIAENYWLKVLKLKPFAYFLMAYFGDNLFDTLQSFIKFLSSKEVRKKVFDNILNWLLDNLSKMKSND